MEHQIGHSLLTQKRIHKTNDYPEILRRNYNDMIRFEQEKNSRSERLRALRAEQNRRKSRMKSILIRVPITPDTKSTISRIPRFGNVTVTSQPSQLTQNEPVRIQSPIIEHVEDTTEETTVSQSQYDGMFKLITTESFDITRASLDNSQLVSFPTEEEHQTPPKANVEIENSPSPPTTVLRLFKGRLISPSTSYTSSNSYADSINNLKDIEEETSNVEKNDIYSRDNYTQESTEKIPTDNAVTKPEPEDIFWRSTNDEHLNELETSVLAHEVAQMQESSHAEITEVQEPREEHMQESHFKDDVLDASTTNIDVEAEDDVEAEKLEDEAEVAVVNEDSTIEGLESEHEREDSNLISTSPTEEPRAQESKEEHNPAEGGPSDQEHTTDNENQVAANEDGNLKTEQTSPTSASEKLENPDLVRNETSTAQEIRPELDSVHNTDIEETHDTHDTNQHEISLTEYNEPKDELEPSTPMEEVTDTTIHEAEDAKHEEERLIEAKRKEEQDREEEALREERILREQQEQEQERARAEQARIEEKARLEAKRVLEEKERAELERVAYEEELRALEAIRVAEEKERIKEEQEKQQMLLESAEQQRKEQERVLQEQQIEKERAEREKLEFDETRDKETNEPVELQPIQEKEDDRQIIETYEKELFGDEDSFQEQELSDVLENTQDDDRIETDSSIEPASSVLIEPSAELAAEDVLSQEVSLIKSQDKETEHVPHIDVQAKSDTKEVIAPTDLENQQDRFIPQSISTVDDSIMDILDNITSGKSSQVGGDLLSRSSIGRPRVSPRKISDPPTFDFPSSNSSQQLGSEFSFFESRLGTPSSSIPSFESFISQGSSRRGSVLSQQLSSPTSTNSVVRVTTGAAPPLVLPPSIILPEERVVLKQMLRAWWLYSLQQKTRREETAEQEILEKLTTMRETVYPMLGEAFR